MGALFSELRDSILERRPVALATVVRGDAPGAKLLVSNDGVKGTLGNEGLDFAVKEDAFSMLQLGLTGIRTYGRTGRRRLDDVEVFIESFAPPPRMYVFGAIDFTGAVARLGKFLGYHVTVCDAREKFATAARFPDADEVVVRWPDEFLADAEVDRRTVICALTHDPKFDVPLLKAALKTDAGYIGAMGSRRTHTERCQQLRDEGVSDEEIARISGPIGLDIGARTPEEVAVSIASEIIALRTDASGRRLVDLGGPVHAPLENPSSE
ncbi:MAG: XdhC/CoxI family protein [Actinomycetota bacterium]